MNVQYKNNLDEASSNVMVNLMSDENKNSITESTAELNRINFLSKLDLLASTLKNDRNNSTKIKDFFEFFKKCGKIFRIENTIPCIIESEIYDIIIALVEDFSIEVFDLLTQIIDCPIEDMILLLKNGIGTILLDGLNNDNVLIFQKSIECINIILFKRSENIEEDIFLYLLIVSLNVIEIIINRLTNITEDEDIIKSFMEFSYVIFEKIPQRDDIDNEIINDSLENFLNECQNAEIYQSEIYNGIIQDGILFSESSVYYQLLINALSYAAGSDDSEIVYNFCHIVYSVLNYDITTYELIFVKLNFLEYSEDWIKRSNSKIVNMYAIIISLLFSEPEIIDQLSSEHLDNFSTLILYIFDLSSETNDENIQLSIAISLINFLCCNDISSLNLLDEERIKLICSKIILCSYKVAQKYAYLYLFIASEIDDFNQIMNEEVLEKIIFMMAKKKGNFVQSSLKFLNMILEKQLIQNKNDLLTALMEFDGCELIEDMIISEDTIVSNLANQISENFFSN